MKKILYLFVALNLMLSSCSHDDSNEPDNGNNVTLPKKMQYTNPDYPNKNITSAIKYVGNRIVSVTTEQTRTDYTYEGNLIVKITTYDIRYNKNDKLVEDSYSYKGGKLSSWISTENFTSEFPFGEYRSKSVYTYNADDTITKEKYEINTTTGKEAKSNYFDVFTYKSGNLIKVVSTDGNSVPYSISTSIYEYDTKNNPFKNVLGLNLLLKEDYDSNNLIKNIYSSGSSSSTNETVYEYNENGYATKQINYKNNRAIGATTEYFY